MKYENENIPEIKSDPAAGQSSDDAQDGLDENTRIEIALTSEDPEWVAYTFNVLGTLIPADEETMARLEKRALTLTLDRMAFSNDALADAIAAFIGHRIAGRPDGARLLIYPLLSFLGCGSEEASARAYSVLSNIASDRPEHFRSHVETLTALQSYGSDNVREYADGIVAVLARQRPEYFTGTEEEMPSNPPTPGQVVTGVDTAEKEMPGMDSARAISSEAHQAPERSADPVLTARAKDSRTEENKVPTEPAPAIKPATPITAQPGAHKEPAPTPKQATPVKVLPEAHKEPAPTPKQATPVVTQTLETERYPDSGKRSLAFSLTRKIKGGNHDGPAAEAVPKKAAGKETDEMDEIIDSLSDITRMIKTGLPAAGTEPVAPARKGSPVAHVAVTKAVEGKPTTVPAAAAPVAKSPGGDTVMKKDTAAAIASPEKTAPAATANNSAARPADQAAKSPKAESPVKEPARPAVLPAVNTKIQKPVQPVKNREKSTPRPRISIRPLKSEGPDDKT